jgi:hypothetical protein
MAHRVIEHCSLKINLRSLRRVKFKNAWSCTCPCSHNLIEQVVDNFQRKFARQYHPVVQNIYFSFKGLAV